MTKPIKILKVEVILLFVSILFISNVIADTQIMPTVFRVGITNLSDDGKTIIGSQETVNFMPSYNSTSVVIEQEAANASSNATTSEIKQMPISTSVAERPQVLQVEPREGNYHLITRDSAWTILQNDYITDYIDYDFVYVNDSYYRVDWKWNDEYVKDILRTCISLQGRNQKECMRSVTVAHILSDFNPSKLEGWHHDNYRRNVSTTCVALNAKEHEKCRKNLTEFYFEQIDFNAENFTKSFFPKKSMAALLTDLQQFKDADMPKKVVRGNARFVGNVNPLNKERGSFYIELKDGFYYSNGLIVEWGMNSVLAEFNNSRTEENLTFTGNQTIIRHLKLPKDAIIANATIILSGKTQDKLSFEERFKNSSNIDTAATTADILTNESPFWSTLNKVIANQEETTHDSYCQVSPSNSQFLLDGYYAAENFTSRASKIRAVVISSADGTNGLSLTGGISTSAGGSFVASKVLIRGQFPIGSATNALYQFDTPYTVTVNNAYYAKVQYSGTEGWYGFRSGSGCYDLGKLNFNGAERDDDLVFKVYYLNYSIGNSTIKSVTLDSSNKNIYRATFNVSETTTGGTSITYYLTSDGGSNWTKVIPAITLNISGVGSDLKWKADIATNDSQLTAELHSLNISVPESYPFNPSLEVGGVDGVPEWNYSGSFSATSTTANFNKSIKTFLETCVADSNGFCYVPVSFTSNDMGIMGYSGVSVVYSLPPKFTVNTTDDSDSTNPTDQGMYVTFTANVSDADSDDVKLLVCDSSGRSGTGCLNTEYCSTVLAPPGTKSCQLNTTNFTAVEYNWTSFACDNSSACVVGVNVTFYISRPTTPAMFVNGTEVWNYTGLFDGPVTVENFDDELRNDANACQGTSECNISLTFYSDSSGKLELSLINIQYQLYDTSPPQVYSIVIEPNPVLRNSSMNVTVNATDNANLTRVSAAHKEGSVNLTYNTALGLWKGILISPSTIGNYQLNITATDSSNLTTINSTGGSGTSNSSSNSSCSGVCVQSGGSSNAELLIDSSEIVYSPSIPTEKSNITINATIYNSGQGATNNFKVQFKIGEVQQTDRTISLGALNSTVIQFSWNATVGNHTIKIAADYTNVITEDNETNNNGSINVTAADITPPSIGSVSTKRGSLEIKVNITDNQNISSAVAVVNGTTIALTYNQTSGYYEGTDMTVSPGTYPMTIRVTDVNGLTTTAQTEVTVYPNPIDLAISQQDLTFSEPSPADQETVTISAVVLNRGVNSSGNFTVEFLLDNASRANNTVSVAGDGNFTTQFSWAAVYGNHTVTIKIDAKNNVSEVNESNNVVTRNITVSDVTPPTINRLSLAEIVYEGGLLAIKANVTDNVNVSRVNATISSSLILFVYNSATKMYENTSFVAPAAGTLNLEVIATDTNSLVSNLTESIAVYGVAADLTLGTGDILLSPDNVTENSQLSINATFYNRGGTNANSVKAELLIDGASKQNSTYSFAKGAKNVTQFTWTASYGPHNLTVRIDPDSSVAEANESNNEKNRTFFVIDATPPPLAALTATPPNWTNQTTHTISWTAVSDANGVSRYEYRVNDGNWVGIGLNTSFVTQPLTEGTHTVYVRATDIPGNVGNASNVSVFIDQTGPGTPVIREWHSGQNWTSHDTPYLSWVDPGDEGSGVARFAVSVNEGSETSLGYNLSYHSLNLTTGVHTFKMKAYDALNQSSNWSNTITVYIDTTLPSAPTVTSPTHPDNTTWYANNVPFFNITPSSDNSGVQGYFYAFDKSSNTTPDTMSEWTTNTTLNITGFGGASSGLNGTNNTILGVGNGEWYLHVIAQDSAGNLGTQAAHYNVKVNATVDDLAIAGLKAMYSNLTEKVFEFAINNSGDSNISSNWTLNLGDGNVVSSVQNANLNSSKSLLVYVQHSYASQGDYSVTATGQGGGSIASKSIAVEVEYLGVSNFSVLNSSGTLRTFEAYVRNYMTVNMTNVSWSLSTGNGVVSSTSPITLQPQETALVFVKYNYTATGTFAANLTAVNSSWMDWEVVNVTIT